VEAEALAARAEFDAFLAKYEKTLRYASDPREYVHRLRVFASNLATARERQRDDRANGGSATHGVTKFMDLTPEEFRETYLGAKIDAETLDKIRASASLSLSDDDESASDEKRPAADDTTDEESFDGVSVRLRFLRAPRRDGCRAPKTSDVVRLARPRRGDPP
jgi:hypothetical protein